MTNMEKDVGCGSRDRPAGKERREVAEANIAAAFEPYLDAVLSSEASGDDEFDRDVTGARDLALFLAHKAVEIFYKTKA